MADDDGRLVRSISDTAFLTAAVRAQESERKDALFSDPLAALLAGERGPRILRAFPRAGLLAYQVVVRTAVIDELVSSAVDVGAAVVIDLAAGLDTRPYRLPLPPSLRWVEVDLPDVVRYKDDVLAGETPRCHVERVPLDLADRSARRELFERVCGESDGPVLAMTEGLLAYLDATAVAALAEDLHEQPCVTGWVTELASAVITEWRGTEDLGSPDTHLLFAPAEGTAFFEPHGWREAEYREMFDEGARLGRNTELTRMIGFMRRSGGGQSGRRVMGVVRLGRTG